MKIKSPVCGRVRSRRVSRVSRHRSSLTARVSGNPASLPCFTKEGTHTPERSGTCPLATGCRRPRRSVLHLIPRPLYSVVCLCCLNKVKFWDRSVQIFTNDYGISVAKLLFKSEKPLSVIYFKYINGLAKKISYVNHNSLIYLYYVICAGLEETF